MKCKHCGSEWNSQVKVDNCPFCGKSLVEPNVNCFEQAIRNIIEKKGCNYLKDPVKTVSFISDLVPDSKGKIQALKGLFTIKTVEQMINISSKEETEQRDILLASFINVQHYYDEMLGVLCDLAASFDVPQDVISSVRNSCVQKKSTLNSSKKSENSEKQISKYFERKKNDSIRKAPSYNNYNSNAIGFSGKQKVMIRETVSKSKDFYEVILNYKAVIPLKDQLLLDNLKELKSAMDNNRISYNGLSINELYDIINGKKLLL